MKKANFLGKKLLFITAHPDDESYAVGGTIFENVKQGGESHLICVTLGERGRGHLLKPLTTQQLKQARREELKCASKKLNISSLHILDLPDGQILNNKSIAHKKITGIVKKLKPNHILSFGPDGISGHLDHIALNKISQKIAREQKIQFIAFAVSPSRLKLNPKFFASRRKFGKYAPQISYQEPDARIKINSAVKVKAVSCHKTQLGHNKPFAHLPKKLKKEILLHEYFKIN